LGKRVTQISQGWGGQITKRLGFQLRLVGPFDVELVEPAGKRNERCEGRKKCGEAGELKILGVKPCSYEGGGGDLVGRTGTLVVRKGHRTNPGLLWGIRANLSRGKEKGGKTLNRVGGDI